TIGAVARGGASALLVFALLTSTPAQAGPPLITDDPVPTSWRHWEIVAPLTLDSDAGNNVAGVPGLDVNYGGGKNLQLTFGTELTWEAPFESGARLRPGGVELAAKVRFATFGRENRQTQLAIFPRFIVPETGSLRSAASGVVVYEWPVVWIVVFDALTRVYVDV